MSAPHRALPLGAALLLLLLAGPGAAAQAPVPVVAGPRAPAAAGGKAKKLEQCATVRVSGRACRAKKRGKVLLVKDPAVAALKDGEEEEEPADLSPNRFAKQYAKTYSSGAGPTANAKLAGQPVVAAALDGVGFKKNKSGTGKMNFRVAPSDREALAALDLATDGCEVVFLTPCNVPPPPTPACTYSESACAAGSICPGGTAVSAECADRSAFAENPCACTALQQLAALSETLQLFAPWDDLANAAYCEAWIPDVGCTAFEGVQLPTSVVNGLFGVGIAGTLPPSLGELRLLTDLGLPENTIFSLPTEVGALTSLTSLSLGGNNLTAAGVPGEIAALTGLANLDLSNNALTSLLGIGGLTGLANLDLSNNALTSLLGIGGLTSLLALGLSGNGLSSVPTELAALNGLRDLALGGNGLSSVPPELAALTGLRVLGLSNNALTSPAEIAALTNLEVLLLLDLSGNNFSTVPTEIAAFTSLEVLFLGNNALTSLPTEIGLLSSVTWLTLNDNALDTVPSEIANLAGLNSLYLDGNLLEGFPSGLRDWAGPTGPPFGSGFCTLFNNTGFSCANVGFSTSCCTERNCGDIAECYTG